MRRLVVFVLLLSLSLWSQTKHKTIGTRRIGDNFAKASMKALLTLQNSATFDIDDRQLVAVFDDANVEATTDAEKEMFLCVHGIYLSHLMARTLGKHAFVDDNKCRTYLMTSLRSRSYVKKQMDDACEWTPELKPNRKE